MSAVFILFFALCAECRSAFSQADVICKTAIATVPQNTVRLGETLQLGVSSNGVPLTDGIWYVAGDASSGGVTREGLYLPPDVLPAKNTVWVYYVYANGVCSPGINVTILNSAPRISWVEPGMVDHLTTPVLIHGTGFRQYSTLTINGKTVPFQFHDSTLVAATIALDQPVSGSVNVMMSNPDPGAISSSASVPANFPGLGSVTPSTFSGGDNTFTVTGNSFTTQTVLMVDGKVVPSTYVSPTTMTGSVFVAPWRTSPVAISFAASPWDAANTPVNVPIQPTAVPYDVAARFATQAAFGPRPDIVQHIQQIGLRPFVEEQLQQPALPYTYVPYLAARVQYLRGATAGNSLLRMRVATALSTFLVNQVFIDDTKTYSSWERTLETDALGNVRKLLTDVASDALMGQFLNLAGNAAPADPNLHPNQNFARELMQLFATGPVMLNEDGTVQMDGSGKPVPAYDQSTVLDLSRALTGWEFGPVVDQNFTLGPVDYSQPLVPHDDEHDHGAKTMFGSVQLAAGQDIVTDREKALDAIFQHPNLPPFFALRLIQHLVTSNPSPAYIQRISAVFKDNGHGVRGDLPAVVTAILLDPEARAGDTMPGPNDGFLQDPLMFQIFAASTIQQDIADSKAGGTTALLGEPLWGAPSVNGFYSPGSMIPGTSVLSPEFNLWNTGSVVNRSEILYGMVTGTSSAYGNDYMNRSWLFTRFNNVPDLVDALNHLIYHGTMPASETSAITAYCAAMGTTDLHRQFAAAIFLALNADSANVTH